jgi:hypothetical protein
LKKLALKIIKKRNMTDIYQILPHPSKWGPPYWTVNYRIALGLDAINQSDKDDVFRQYIQATEFLLVCMRCVMHYHLYITDYPLTLCNNAFERARFYYDLEQSIKKRNLKRQIHGCKSVKDKQNILLKQTCKSFEETIAYYQQMPIETYLDHVIAMLHFCALALTLEDKKTAVVEAVQKTYTIFLPKLLPMPPTFWKMLQDNLTKSTNPFATCESLLNVLYTFKQGLNNYPK